VDREQECKGFCEHVMDNTAGELRLSCASPCRGTHGVEWCLASAAAWCSSTFTVCIALILLLSDAVLHVSATDAVQSASPHRVRGMCQCRTAASYRRYPFPQNYIHYIIRSTRSRGLSNSSLFEPR